MSVDHYEDVHGWQGLWFEGDGIVVGVPKTIGPRVVHLGPSRQQNLFYLQPDQCGGTKEDEWLLRGGHRLWLSPEYPEMTYFPDNIPVQLSTTDQGLLVTGPVEQPTGVRKELTISFPAPETVRIDHTLRNMGSEPLECAPWALTVLPAGGRALIPFPTRDGMEDQLLPLFPMTLWPYTHLQHPCWQFSDNRLLLDTGRVESKQKIGIGGDAWWLGMEQNEWLVVKTATFVAGGNYPDNGSRLEVYSDGTFLELETLGELVELNPGDSIQHTEWMGFEPLDAECPDDVLWQRAEALAHKLAGMSG